MNSIAGGGTLITFPLLIFVGISPITANATSTLALVIGVSGSVWGYRSHISGVKSWFRTLIPVSIVGGLIGSYLLTLGDDRIFSKLVPYLILIATILFMLQKVIRSYVAKCWKIEARGAPSPWHLTGAMIFQLLISVYGGYFGAGIGILMLAALGIMGMNDIHGMNALKGVLGFLINITAALWFILHGLIDWPVAGVMVLGSLAGGYLGSTYAQRLPQSRVRQLVSAIGLLITAVMFWKLK